VDESTISLVAAESWVKERVLDFVQCVAEIGEDYAEHFERGTLP
jgi:hypothetical protein